MPRKKISDLIRDEAQKLGDSEAESAEKTPATDETKADIKSSEPLANGEAENTKTTLSELETTVTQLRTALQEAQDKEGDRDRLISEVQSELEQHRSLIQNLEGQLNQAYQRHEELEKANQDLQSQLQEEKTRSQQLEQELDRVTRDNSELKAAQEKLLSELEDKNTVNEHLTSEVKQVAQLQKELDAAKKSALQLAESNEKLTGELKALEGKGEKSRDHNLPVKSKRPTTSEVKVFPDPFSTSDLNWMD